MSRIGRYNGQERRCNKNPRLFGPGRGKGWGRSVGTAVAAAAKLQPDVKAGRIVVGDLGHGPVVHLKTAGGRTIEPTHGEADHGAATAVFAVTAKHGEDKIRRSAEHAGGAADVHHLVGGGKGGVQIHTAVVVLYLQGGAEGAVANHRIKQAFFTGFPSVSELKCAVAGVEPTGGVGPTEILRAKAAALATEHEAVDHHQALSAGGQEAGAEGRIAVGAQQIVERRIAKRAQAEVEEAKTAVLGCGLGVGGQAEQAQAGGEEDVFFHDAVDWLEMKIGFQCVDVIFERGLTGRGEGTGGARLFAVEVFHHLNVARLLQFVDLHAQIAGCGTRFFLQVHKFGRFYRYQDRYDRQSERLMQEGI